MPYEATEESVKITTEAPRESQTAIEAVEQLLGRRPLETPNSDLQSVRPSMNSGDLEMMRAAEMGELLENA